MIKLGSIISVAIVFITTTAFAQKFFDSSVYYSITNIDKKGKSAVLEETYRLYVDKKGILPYLNEPKSSNVKTTRGGDYLFYAVDNEIYLKYKDEKMMINKKLFSLTIHDTIAIGNDLEYPMMCFLFGDKSVYEGIESVILFGEKQEAYKFKLFFDEYSYTYLYLQKDDLLPLRYEIVDGVKGSDETSRILVTIDKVSGKTYNGKAAAQFNTSLAEAVCSR